jgi:hypothetical protein
VQRGYSRSHAVLLILQVHAGLSAIAVLMLGRL